MEGFTNFDFYNYIFADNIGIDIFVRFKRVVMEYRQFLDGINRKEDKAWVELYDYFYAAMRQKLWGMTRWWKMWCRDVS